LVAVTTTLLLFGVLNALLGYLEANIGVRMIRAVYDCRDSLMAFLLEVDPVGAGTSDDVTPASLVGSPKKISGLDVT
jgi:hypothetical protein